MGDGDAGSGLALLRGVTLAVLCALLTALGHLAGGGALPDIALTIVLLPLLVGALTTIAQRCTSLVGATLTLAVGQVVLHLLLVTLHPTHVGIGSVAAVPATGMIVMHVLATMATAVVVCGADRAVLMLVAALRRAVPRTPVGSLVAIPLLMPAVAGPAISLRLARALSAPVARRGPPTR